jgi:hypothetical protein
MKQLFTLCMLIPSTAVVGQTTQRNGLAEEFANMYCSPCKPFFDRYHPTLVSLNANDTAAHLNAITYQMDYPAPDFSYNLHASQRHDYYTLLGIPDLRVNGQGISTASTAAQLYTALDTSRNSPSSFIITGTYIVNAANNTLNIDIKILPLSNMTGTYKVHTAIIERHYNNPASTVAMYEYYNVMRRMFPDGNGTTEPNWTANTAKTYSYQQSYTVTNPPAPGSFDFWGDPLLTDVIVFVQDSATRMVMQSQLIRQGEPLGITTQDPMVTLECFPNPAKDYIGFSFRTKEAGNYKLEIVDLNGRCVKAADYTLASGRHQLRIATDGMASGCYIARLSDKNGTVQKRISVLPTGLN